MDPKVWLALLSSVLALVASFANFLFTRSLARQKGDHEARLLALTAQVQLYSSERSAAMSSTREGLQTQIEQALATILSIQRLKDAIKVIIHGIRNPGIVDREEALSAFSSAEKDMRTSYDPMVAWLPKAENDLLHKAVVNLLPLRTGLRKELLGITTIDFAGDELANNLSSILDILRTSQAGLRAAVEERQNELGRGAVI